MAVTDPFAGLTDVEVLEIAKGHLRRESELPPLSLARLAAGQQYDRARDELDRRAFAFALARLAERGIRPGEPDQGGD
jgi:hypothetical protein